MEKSKWEPRRLIETNYAKKVNSIAIEIWRALFEIDNALEMLEWLNVFLQTEYFDRLTQKAASSMVTGLLVDGSRTWREAAQKSMKGRQIYDALKKELQGPVGLQTQNQIQHNATLIKTLPANLARQITEYVGEETIKGRRSEAIAEEIKRMFPAHTRANATLIARTEVSKTNTALTQARSQNIGVNWYEWITETDIRVRHSHKIMHGVLVNWNDPPSPELLAGEKRNFGKYHAGGIFNCRCFVSPLTDLRLVEWPCKVYYGGTIKIMSKSQFEKL